MVADHTVKQLHYARDAIATITQPLHWIANLPTDGIAWLDETITSHHQLLTENRELKKLNTKLQGRILRFTALEEENDRLRTQLNASLNISEHVTLTKLIGIDLTPYKQEMTINKGGSSGVYDGQAVISATGILGQVSLVTPFRSKVLLITDAQHSIPVRFLGSGVHTIAKGTGRVDRLELPYLPENINVRLGDILVSSGLGGRFPPGYPVAKVTAISKNQTAYGTTVVAAPLAKLSQNQDVMLVWSISSEFELESSQNTLTDSAKEN